MTLAMNHLAFPCGHVDVRDSTTALVSALVEEGAKTSAPVLAPTLLESSLFSLWVETFHQSRSALPSVETRPIFFNIWRLVSWFPEVWSPVLGAACSRLPFDTSLAYLRCFLPWAAVVPYSVGMLNSIIRTYFSTAEPHDKVRSECSCHDLPQEHHLCSECFTWIADSRCSWSCCFMECALHLQRSSASLESSWSWYHLEAPWVGSA